MPSTPLFFLFFLVLLGLGKTFLWVLLLRALWFPVRLYRFMWSSPGFVVLRSIGDRVEVLNILVSLSLRRLVTSNLGKHKDIYPMFAAKLSLFLNLLL